MKKVFVAGLILIGACSFVGCEVAELDESDRQNERTDNVGLDPKSIFVATDRHDIGQGNNLKALVQIVSQNILTDKPDYYLLGGDNVGRGAMLDSMAMPPYKLSDVYSEICGGDGRADVRFLSTYGSHDNGCTDSYYDFFSGPRACDGYYLYGVSYAQMCFAADSSARNYNGLDRIDTWGISAESASRAFLRWADGLNDKAPVIIMSHVPIHANRGDNPGAAIWADAINKVAVNHDVILMFGHNHTNEEMAMPGAQNQGQSQALDSIPQDEFRRDSIPQDTIPRDTIQQVQRSMVNDQDYYLLLPGSHLPVQTADLAVQDTVTIQFVYMNAGYIKLGYASTISLSDDNADGTYDCYKIRRYTVNDTVISHFGNTDIPNPVTLHSNEWK